MKSFMFALIIILLSFGLQGQTSHLERLSTAPVIESSICYEDLSYNTFYCKFTDKDTIRYYHYNRSPVYDFDSVYKVIDSTIIATFKKANKTAIHSNVNTDLVIIYEYLDGIGGTLAQASPPSCDSSTIQRLVFDNYDMPPGENAPESIRVLYRNPKDIVTVTKHELGHILGLRHNDGNPNYMMYSRYRGQKDWHKHENSFFDLHFGMNDFILVDINNKDKITENFRFSEYFSKCRGLNFHMLDRTLPISIQDLRKFVGSPIYINSSYRYPKCNQAAGGVSRSQHVLGRAVDFRFANQTNHDKFVNDILNKGDQYWILVVNGIKGIGLYDTHIHIDTRTTTDEVVIWDYRNSLIKGCGL